MKKLHFSISISAPKEKVWDTMLGAETYKKWTHAFHPGSRFEGSWDEGSKIVFIGPDEESGEEMGMVSMIEANRKYEFLSILHKGFYKNGVEDYDSDEVKKWTPAHENYTFREENGVTEVLVDLDVAEEYAPMFEDQWPKALEELKKIAEA